MVKHFRERLSAQIAVKTFNELSESVFTKISYDNYTWVWVPMMKIRTFFCSGDTNPKKVCKIIQEGFYEPLFVCDIMKQFFGRGEANFELCGLNSGKFWG